MPSRRPPIVRTRDQIVTFETDSDDGKQRMITELARIAAVQPQSTRSSVVVNLVIGNNNVVHNLGRTPVGATITPTIASAAFAWAMTSKNERSAVIAVVGLDMPNAEVEFH